MIDQGYKKDISLTFVINGLQGVCYIDVRNKDLNGFYSADTVIYTPHGKFAQTCCINPKMLVPDYEKYIINVLSNRCFDAYTEALKNDRQTI